MTKFTVRTSPSIIDGCFPPFPFPFPRPFPVPQPFPPIF